MSTRTMVFPLRFAARFVVEFRTPFLIGSGEGDYESDAVFVADANGLPSLPGSSIAGALRHAAEKSGMEQGTVDRLFGYQHKDDGRGSRLTFTWGHIHNSLNQPVEGRLSEDALEADTVLAHGRHADLRDHVRIGHRGAAVSRQKFDERCVPAGHRFTFDVMLEGNDGDRDDWNELLGLLCSPHLRLGGKSRRGFGAYRVVSLKKGEFNLPGGDLQAFRGHPVRLDQEAPGLEEVDIEKITGKGTSDGITATLDLEPEGFWMIGGGDDFAIDLMPLTESRVVWSSDGRGCIGPEELLVPGTALKGPLAHRTAYHYNALNGIYADDLEPDEFDVHTGSNNMAVREIFGRAKGNEDEEDTEGQRGRILIDDLYLGTPGSSKVLNHVAIDRFTGGAMRGALFTEKALYKSMGFTLTIHVSEAEDIPPGIRKAFLRALNDLAEGRLSLGGGTGRGNGVFMKRGEVRWSDNGAWAGGAK